MTTANLMNLSSVNGKFAAQIEASKKMQDENLKVAEAFAGFMNQANQALDQMVDDVASNVDMQVDGTQSVTESYERYNYKDNRIEDAKTPAIEDKLEESTDALEQAEQDVIDAVCEEYGVSEEEVQKLLEDMGLNALDLLNPKNLANFIMQLTGLSASEELILDPGFLKIMGTMETIAEGLMKDLNVDMDGLQELVNQIEVVNDETEIPVSFDGIVEDTVENQNTEETVPNTMTAEETDAETLEVQIENTKDTSHAAETAAKEGAVSEEAAETVAKEAVQAETKDTPVKTVEENADTQQKDSMFGQDAESKSFTSNQNAENSLLNHQANAETVVVNQTNTNVNPVSEMPQTQFASYLGNDTVQIMEQIVQQMRVTISETTTSMEMQLNPANLGKVYVNITSEEGVVNAQFHATNEAVKEALETQIATLRENLTQAGVKVDAIEVTIASHEFERNLEQNHQNPEEQVENQEKKTAKRRNISMDSLDDLAGVMTEEETLVAQIMKENGNSVDFTA